MKKRFIKKKDYVERAFNETVSKGGQIFSTSGFKRLINSHRQTGGRI